MSGFRYTLTEVKSMIFSLAPTYKEYVCGILRKKRHRTRYTRN